MPPIPIYSSSPISATKASGVTPKTAEPEAKPVPSAAAAPTPTKTRAYAPAMPGATPALPVQTATATAQASQPPPPPQPGAVPSSLPPPPRAGESYTPPPTTAMPPQMSIPPPAPSYASYQGTSAASAHPTQPIFLGNAGGGGGDLSHPPGYQQNTSADQFTSQQRHQASLAEGRTYDADEGVWDQAKKWASGVGDSLVAAESEVWKRINKQ